MTKKKNDDNELFKSLLKLNIRYAIEDSNINIRMIDNRIKSYQTLIGHLEDNKPFFFQKKKLIEYNNKKEEYENKISEYLDQYIVEKNIEDMSREPQSRWNAALIYIYKNI